MNKRKAIIAGATGLVGSFLVNKLQENDLYEEIYVLNRRKINYNDPKLKEIITDYSDLEEAIATIKADDVFCCLGTTINKAGSKEAFEQVDYEYPVKLADIMIGKGAKRYFIVTALGANKNSMIFYNRVKGRVEEKLKEIGFSGLFIFRPSLLLGDRNEKRTGEDMAKKVYKYLDKLFFGPFKKYKSIHAETVAEAISKTTHNEDRGIHIFESDRIREV